MKLTVTHDFLPKTNSTRAAMVMDHFGIDFERGRHVVVEDLDLQISDGDLVLFTGESGSGKSSLMRAVCAELTARGKNILDLTDLHLGDRILVNEIQLPFAETLQLLANCGLGESHLMLRTAAELSDGQRYRFRLAKAISMNPDWIVADEFTAALDRTLAKVLAFNLRKLTNKTRIGFLLATAHDDITPDLSPDVHVTTTLSGEINVHYSEHSDLKKKRRSTPNSGSPPDPNPTGRISLGGITAAIA